MLESRSFADAARAILAACRAILGGQAGFVATVSPDGAGLEVACADPGSLGLPSTDGLPAPLRRLCARASRAGLVVIANDPAKGVREAYSAGGGAPVENVIVAPVLVRGGVVGLIVVLNKPRGFSSDDSRLAELFAELVGAALTKSRSLNGFEENRSALEEEIRTGAAQLQEAEEKFKTLVENLPDLIARFDPLLRYLYVSPTPGMIGTPSPATPSPATPSPGTPSPGWVGKSNRELGVTPEIAEPWDAALARVFATGRPERIELSLPGPGGTRRLDCRLVPEPDAGSGIPSVLSVVRDVTDRWQASEAERRARNVAEALREATVALTRSLDRETVLATLLDRLRRLVPFDRASVMLLEAARQVSVRAVFDGDRVVPLPVEERPVFDPADHPVVHGILTSGKAVVIPDVGAHPGWSLPTDRTSEASWMGVPLFARGDVAGLFSLSKREAGYFNHEHVRLAEAMSSQASVAVENAVLFEQMQASTLRMQSLSRLLVDAQESERRSIARELHDEAGQALVSLRFGLRLLEREIDGGSNVTGRVAELMQTTDAVIDGLHRLAADLRPASLDVLGLEAAIRQYARSAASKSGLLVRFKARGLDGGRLPAAVETALYRVVQEAMTNVVRHARATRADVLVERRGGRVVVVVEDDGVGFEPGRVLHGDHLGLLGLRERAEALGGTLTIESAPGAGTTVVVEVDECRSAS